MAQDRWGRCPGCPGWEDTVPQQSQAQSAFQGQSGKVRVTGNAPGSVWEGPWAGQEVQTMSEPEQAQLELSSRGSPGQWKCGKEVPPQEGGQEITICWSTGGPGSRGRSFFPTSGGELQRFVIK